MKEKRKGISKKTRFEVFKRDGFKCQYCGSHPPQSILHVDHIIPVADGGKHDMDNFVTACDICNLGKGARSLADIPASLSDRAALVKEQEEQIRGYAETMAAKRDRVESDCWQVANLFTDQFSLDGIRKDWFQSIKSFIEKIGLHECIEAMELATAKMVWSKDKCFRYFCGICWRKVRGE